MFCKLENLFIFLLFFHYSFLFVYISKMISKAWSNIPITFLITQNETHMMKI